MCGWLGLPVILSETARLKVTSHEPPKQIRKTLGKQVTD
jgi:hypothetical protein